MTPGELKIFDTFQIDASNAITEFARLFRRTFCQVLDSHKDEQDKFDARLNEMMNEFGARFREVPVWILKAYSKETDLIGIKRPPYICECFRTVFGDSPTPFVVAGSAQQATGTAPLPEGWREVKSTTRLDGVSYVNIHNGKKQRQRPTRAVFPGAAESRVGPVAPTPAGGGAA